MRVERPPCSLTPSAPSTDPNCEVIPDPWNSTELRKSQTDDGFNPRHVTLRTPHVRCIALQSPRSETPPQSYGRDTRRRPSYSPTHAADAAKASDKFSLRSERQRRLRGVTRRARPTRAVRRKPPAAPHTPSTRKRLRPSQPQRAAAPRRAPPRSSLEHHATWRPHSWQV